MPTMATRKRNEKRRMRGARSGPEKALRQHLVWQKKMKDEDDDLGLLRWLQGLHATSEDHRSQWEKDLEAQIEKDVKNAD